MAADPFSDILQLTNAQSVVSGGFRAGGAWAIRFPEMDKIKFSALVRGTCWLSVEGREKPVRMQSGDVVLLSSRRSFVLAGDLEAVPVDAARVFSGVSGIANVGDGDDCMQIGGFIRLDQSSGKLLLDVLPPLIHVQADSPRAAVLQWLLDQMVRERAAEHPGAVLASAQLAQLVFVHILRAHLETSGDLAAGWLRALGNRRIAPALRLMHGDPGRSWKLEELAKAAAMLRTTFAVHFKTAAGVAPLTYLTEWRMRLAERALQAGNVSVASVAQSVGYTSESAFSHAFKRVTGKAPKRFRAAVREDQRE